MSRSSKLELTWIGKENRPKLEPRILIEDPELSYHAPHRVSEDDIFDNRLIFGDNLLALKALEQEFAGKVKCIFIDPPYNTGSAFEQYDDGVEHSVWLGLMRDRLMLLRRLLAEDGSLWITIDDNESHYLKVLCDEVFGRANFVSNAVWQKKYSPSNDALWLSDDHDHILVYARNKTSWRVKRLPRTEQQDSLYKNPDKDPRGAWMSDNYTCSKSADERPNLYYAIVQPVTGEEIWPRRTRVWAYNEETHTKHVEENRIWWGKGGRNSTPRLKRFLGEIEDKGLACSSIWLYQDAGHNQEARREVLQLNPVEPFATPKPEKLVHRVLTLSTDPGDLVLDSFAGSGTTGAVAHKLGRRWIMVELEETCHTHIIPRLKKVIDGDDPGGVTEATGWKGGGGFRYYRLGPSLLEKDRYGNWVISKDFNPAMLAEAVCKLEGFTYAPSDEVYWQHGQSTETDFIYVTTQTMTHEMLEQLSEEVGEKRSLVIYCAAFRANQDTFPNLTVKKIPKTVLRKCEWGHDDYSLEVKNLPQAPPEPESEDEEKSRGMRSLFDEGSVE